MFILLLGICKLEASKSPVSIMLFSFGGWNDGKRAVDFLFFIFFEGKKTE